jgi:hypothetical protein
MVPSPFDHSLSFVLWESLSEHGSATLRLLFCGLVLNHIPVLRKSTIFKTHDIGDDPGGWLADVGESPV